MPVLEKNIEEPVVTYAKKRGMLVRKMNGTGARAWPDRMFLYGGRALFIEFKKPGGKVTPLQAKLHEDMRLRGFKVWVIEEVAMGKSLIDAFIEGAEEAES